MCRGGVGGFCQGDPGERQGKEAGDLPGPQEVDLLGKEDGRGGTGKPGLRAKASRFMHRRGRCRHTGTVSARLCGGWSPRVPGGYTVPVPHKHRKGRL